jgi:hypothetical protein
VVFTAISSGSYEVDENSIRADGSPAYEHEGFAISASRQSEVGGMARVKPGHARAAEFDQSLGRLTVNQISYSPHQPADRSIRPRLASRCSSRRSGLVFDGSMTNRQRDSMHVVAQCVCLATSKSRCPWRSIFGSSLWIWLALRSLAAG